jgi:hypothetical protein
VGPVCQREKRGETVPVQDFSRVGCGLILGLGQRGSLRSSFIFLFSFLLFFLWFLYSFVSFAKMLQINSNHFQEFSKIQNSPFKIVNNKFPRTNMVLNKASYA